MVYNQHAAAKGISILFPVSSWPSFIYDPEIKSKVGLSSWLWLPVESPKVGVVFLLQATPVFFKCP